MWKDFFYYSKSERRVIALLMILAAILVAANFYSRWRERNIQADYPTDIRQDTTPEASVSATTADNGLQKPDFEQTAPTHPLRPSKSFDPNTATQAELTSQGLPHYVAENILKYRAKGGKFRTPESLQKIYGMDKATYESVKSRIVIGKEYQHKERADRPKYEKIQKFATGTIVNVNTADTATLKRIPGIGSTYARRIIAYRTRLGGYYSIEQLQEVKGLDSTFYKWFETGNTPLQKIKVNQYTLDQLKLHPYMGYYKAKSIIDYRKRYGRIKDIQTFEMFDTFSPSDIERLKPYLSFE